MKIIELKKLIQESMIEDSINEFEYSMSHYRYRSLTYENNSMKITSYFKTLVLEVIKDEFILSDGISEIFKINTKDIMKIDSGKKALISTKAGKVFIN